jgi:hypothetical protein
MSMARKGLEDMRKQWGWGLAVGVTLFVAPAARAKDCAQVCVEDLARNTKLCKERSKKTVECVQMFTKVKDTCLKECRNPSKEDSPPPEGAQ